MTKILSVLAVSLIFSSGLSGTVLRVPEDYGLGIQDAIDHALDGDTVSVQPGTPASPDTFYEALDLKGKDILVAARDSSNADARDINNPDPVATIIDATNNSTHVVKIPPDLTAKPEMRGFTLTNGQAGSVGGAGVYVKQSACVIRKCIIEANSSLNPSPLSRQKTGFFKVG